jgi:hypothetical protein
MSPRRPGDHENRELIRPNREITGSGKRRTGSTPVKRGGALANADAMTSANILALNQNDNRRLRGSSYQSANFGSISYLVNVGISLAKQREDERTLTQH